MKESKMSPSSHTSIWMLGDEVLETNNLRESLPTVRDVVYEVANHFQIPVIHLINNKNRFKDHSFLLLVRLLSDCTFRDAETIATLLNQDLVIIKGVLDQADELLQSDSLLANQFIYLYLKLSAPTS